MMSYLFGADSPLPSILSPLGRYVFSAKGAAFGLAWGIAPGIRATSNPSAESAIHARTRSQVRGNAIEPRDRNLLEGRLETFGRMPKGATKMVALPNHELRRDVGPDTPRDL